MLTNGSTQMEFLRTGGGGVGASCSAVDVVGSDGNGARNRATPSRPASRISTAPSNPLAHVNADAQQWQIGFLRVRLLQAQCTQHCGAGRLEGEKAAIAAPVDDPTGGVRSQLARVRAMPGYQFADGSIAALQLQRHRIRQIRKDPREDP
jgi:hypothetical protein